MTNSVRLRLTLLYIVAIMAFFAITGIVTYGLVQRYFQSITDLALKHKMAHEFASLGLSWPKELADADAYWSIVRKTVLPNAFINTVRQQKNPNAVKGNASWYPQQEIDLEELYDGELAAIILLPLNEQGQIVDAQLDNQSLAQSNGLLNRQALEVANTQGYDLRTITLETNADVRILTYRMPAGKPMAYLQLVRALDDQSFILNSLLVDLAGVGAVIAIAAGFGSWWLAGRSLEKERVLWQRQQTFVANASHELRTPLTFIRANTEVIQRKLPKDADAQPLLTDVLNETDYMNKLVTDLLLLSRLDAQQLKLDLQRVTVSEVFASLQKQLEPLFAKRGLTLAMKESAGLVWADPDRLRQMLLILLDNAQCYTPEGGTVTLRSQMQVSTVEIEVMDTGVGIAPEHLLHVFDRFYHVNQERCEERGSGLGLSIAKALAEAHGGTIQISSVVDNGTSIKLSLPVSSKQNTQAPASQHKFKFPGFVKPIR